MLSAKILLLSLAAVLCLLPPAMGFPQNYTAVKDGVNIRLDSTTFSEIIGTISKGERITATGQKYEWYQVKLPAKTNCWVWSKHIEIEKDSGIVKASSLNIRALPSLEAKIIGGLKKDAEVKIREERNGWLKISCFPYARGWVHSRLLKEAGETLDLANCLAPVETIPALEKKFYKLNPDAIYNIIDEFSKTGKENPELISYFFNKITSDSLLKTAIYLDVLENILLINSPKIPFYYLFQRGGLTQTTAQKAYKFLKETYRQIN